MRFGILGPLEARVGTAPIALARRERVLLAILLLHANRVVSPQRIIDTIWGDHGPQVTASQVHGSVYRLRQRLSAGGVPPEIILTRPSGYQLQLDPQSLDLTEFRELRDRAREVAERGASEEARSGYRAALALWRGPVLDGEDSGVLRQAAATLDEERLQALEQCVEVELSLGRAGEVVAELAGVVGEHPYRESLHAKLMLAFYRAGRPADALAAYRRVRTLMHDDLGIEPGPELQHLHQAILNRDPALAPPAESAGSSRATEGRSSVPRELPADVAGFTGRADAIKALDELLPEGSGGASGPVVISAIAGMAGVGKTALAVHWAHRVADRFPDGQLYLNLRGYAVGSPLAPIDALTALLRSLGVPPEQIPADQAQAAALYRTQLADRTMLVVLDNARSVDQVRPLLPGSPGCLALVSSRDRLTGLVARDGARRITLNVLTPDEAQMLLCRLLGADRTHAEPAATTELARACARLPLALRIAAAILIDSPGRSIEHFTSDLTGHDRIAVLQAEGDAETAVRAAFELSYRTLSGPAQTLFCLLGLVPGPDFSPPAAAAVANIAIREAQRLLHQLASVHLIEENGQDRFAFHDLLRLFAQHRVQLGMNDDSRRDAIHRLLNYYLNAAGAASGVLYPQVVRLPHVTTGESVEFVDASAAWGWFETERTNLVVAAGYATESGMSSFAWLIADCSRGYFWYSRHFPEWTEIANVALRAAQLAGNVQAEASARLNLANIHQTTASYPAAAEHYGLTLELAKRAGWSAGQVAALTSLGSVHRQLGQLPAAAEYHTRALALQQKKGELGVRATILDNLGITETDLGRLGQAAEHLEEALDIFRRLGSAVGEANSLTNFSEVARRLGDLARADRCIGSSLDLFRKLGSRQGVLIATSASAVLKRDLGHLGDALERAEECVALAAEIDSRRLEAETLTILASVEQRLGQYRLSVGHYHRALEAARYAGTRRAELVALLGISDGKRLSNDPAGAEPLAERALAAAVGMGYRLIEGHALISLASGCLAAGRCGHAMDYVNRALENSRDTGHRLAEAHALIVRGHIDAANGAQQQAREHWRAAGALLAGIGAAAPTALPGIT